MKKTISVQSPVDGSELAPIEISDAAAVDAAVSRAQEAFANWGTTPVKK